MITFTSKVLESPSLEINVGDDDDDSSVLVLLGTFLACVAFLVAVRHVGVASAGVRASVPAISVVRIAEDAADDGGLLAVLLLLFLGKSVPVQVESPFAGILIVIGVHG